MIQTTITVTVKATKTFSIIIPIFFWKIVLIDSKPASWFYSDFGRFATKIYLIEVLDTSWIRLLAQLVGLEVESLIYFCIHKDMYIVCLKVKNKWRALTRRSFGLKDGIWWGYISRRQRSDRALSGRLDLSRLIINTWLTNDWCITEG